MPNWIKNVIETLFFSTPKPNAKKLEQHFQNKTVLITGATFGIGEACTRKFAQIPCHLILIARTEEKLKLLKSELENSSCKIDFIIADLYDSHSADLIIQQLKLKKIKIDSIIHNAGKSIQRSIWQTIDRPQDIDRTNAINFLNPAHLTRQLLPDLAQNQGQIIVVSTINAKLFAPPLWSSYQASKTAFAQWISSMQPELKAKNVDASLIYLPLVRTRMIAPTKQYQNMPAMSAEQAANAILVTAIKYQSEWQPWWLIFAQFLSIIFARPIRYFYTFYFKRNK